METKNLKKEQRQPLTIWLSEDEFFLLEKYASEKNYKRSFAGRLLMVESLKRKKMDFSKKS